MLFILLYYLWKEEGKLINLIVYVLQQELREIFELKKKLINHSHFDVPLPALIQTFEKEKEFFIFRNFNGTALATLFSK